MSLGRWKKSILYLFSPAFNQTRKSIQWKLVLLNATIFGPHLRIYPNSVHRALNQLVRMGWIYHVDRHSNHDFYTLTYAGQRIHGWILEEMVRRCGAHDFWNRDDAIFTEQLERLSGATLSTNQSISLASEYAVKREIKLAELNVI